MAKRFVDTELWFEDWYIKYPLEYKLFWYYLISSCDHAGIWKVKKVYFERAINKTIDLDDFLEKINSDKQRIRQINDNRWLIEDFIVFQYGKYLNMKNRVHVSILKILENNNIDLTSIRGLLGVKKTPT